MPKRKRAGTGDAERRRRAEEQRQRRRRMNEEQIAANRISEAERQRRRRAQESEEEASRQRLEDAERHRLARLRETEEEASRQRLEDAERHRFARSQETEEEASRRRSENAERNRVARSQETAEEASLRQLEDAERHEVARSEETEEERRARQLEDAERHEVSRSEETEEERRARQLEDAERHEVARAQETEEERRARQLADAERRRVPRTETVAGREERLRSERRRRTRSRLHNVGRTASSVQVEAHTCGSLDSTCEHCGGLFFPTERNSRGKYTPCCHGGIIVENERQCPEQLRQLFTGVHDFSVDFFNDIRRYNSVLSFASLGAKVERPPGSGPYCYRIHGAIYHQASHLHPSEPGREKYAQIYILDSDVATRQRMNIMTGVGGAPLNSGLLSMLDALIRGCNPFVEAYKMLREFEEDVIRENGAAGEVTMYIKGVERGSERGRYGAPRENEVAAIFQSTDGAAPSNRDVVIHPRGSRLIRMNTLNPSLEPMTYVLFFPCGDQGYYKNRTFSELDFYAHRISVRRDVFNPIILGRKLFQQYIVDAYVKKEGHDIFFIRRNQTRLRVETYRGLQDHVHRRAQEAGARCGVPVILPSTFIGSPRFMNQNYQDSMAIVRDYGKPDLFITFTCNPKWPEITASLLEGQKAHDRPDIVARVFDIKRRALLDDIKKRHVLGVTVADFHVIEFQKRGLPHMHLLVILAEEDKIRDPETIDMLVRAEIPDETVDPVLHGIVRRSMIHGPCGSLNRNSPCMVDGVCSKGFPKAFQEETQYNEGGYPLYRRRDDSHFVIVRDHRIDNRWVVPYNAYLTKKYDAHINVEVCTSVKSVKYLFKYVYKGHDAARVVMENAGGATLVWDEIKTYLNARYLSAPEGVWRLLEKRMYERSHKVERLAVHLEKLQPVYFNESEERAALARAAQRDTTLTGWFKLNATVPEANAYLYVDIPKHWVWRNYKWTTRVRLCSGGVIGRMYSVSPKDSKRFHLRLLLGHVRGAKSFKELRTYNGVEYTEFKDACRARNLLQDDTEWKNCMAEAATFQMPYQLRQLFSFICVFCNPTEPASLWEEFKSQMSEDFVRDDFSEGDSFDLALSSVREFLQVHGVSLQDLGLPEPSANVPVQASVRVYDAESERQRGEELARLLNPQQKTVFDAVLEAVRGGDAASPKTFFVNAFAGAGKTFLFQTILHAVRGLGYVAVPVAYTGIAAVLLDGGRTAHSTFKLPIPVLENSSCHVRQDSDEGRNLKDARLIVWDECTMTPRYALEAVDRLLRDLTGTQAPFGGKTVLLGGDWRQTLPVIRQGNKISAIENCLRNSPLWELFKTFTLSTNMRLGPEEQAFSQWLMQLGDGSLTNDAGFEEDVIEIPPECVTEGSIVDEIFDLENPRTEDFATKAILCPKNEDALKINEDILTRFPGRASTFCSADAIVCEDAQEQDTYQLDFVNSLTPSGLPPHRLNLKVGAVVMLLRNLHPSMGLCNGTRLIVKNMHPSVLDCEVVTGQNAGSRVFIPRIELSPSDSNLPFELKRRQFPVRLSFAMTINKSQGQTLNSVGIYLPNPVFSHGMLYVAFSRCTSMNRIRVAVQYTRKQGQLIRNSSRVFTQNVVYKEVLQQSSTP